MKIYDLSLAIDDTAFEAHDVCIERVSHAEGVKKVNSFMMKKSFLGKIRFLLGKYMFPRKIFPDGEFLSLETVHAPVHVGTHLDYTFHYGSMSEGKPAKTSSEIPLELCFQNGVKLDMTHIPQGSAITEEDVKKGLEKIGYTLKPLDIVLLQTGADKYYGTADYFNKYPGVSISAIDFLLDNGIKIFGVDAMGIDRPYKNMVSDFMITRDFSNMWPSHLYGRKREFIHIERLANLSQLPSCGFKVSCFPVLIRQTGGAWARVVAFVEE